jgi:hypothetical protein
MKVSVTDAQIIVLGSEPVGIGQGIEPDTCYRRPPSL